jgi:hypothetical protein
LKVLFQLDNGAFLLGQISNASHLDHGLPQALHRFQSPRPATSSSVSVTIMRWMRPTVCGLSIRPVSPPIICAAVPFRAVFAYTDTHNHTTIMTAMAHGLRSELPWSNA